MRRFLVLAFVLLTAAAADLVAQQGPTVDQLIGLKRVGSPAISPDGKHVAYTIREPNWDEDRFETEIWLADAATGRARQLTNAKKSSGAPDWSPDGSMIAFTSDRSDKQQIYVIRVAGGEAEALTAADDGVGGGFAWAPDGKSIAYTITDQKPEAWKTRDKKYGEFEIVDEDQRLSHLWVIDLATKTPKRLTTGAFTVGGFDWSPDGTAIAFDHAVNGDPSSNGTADISVVTIADTKVRPLVTQAGPDRSPRWSPDGRTIAFSSAMAEPFFYFKNTRLASIPVAGGAVTVLTKNFDENPSLMVWRKDGIVFSASQKTAAGIFRLDPATLAITRVTPSDARVYASASLSADGSGAMAFIRSGPGEFPEVWTVSAMSGTLTKVSDMAAQSAAWPKPTQEVITWRSKDGTPIEGVLHKPASFKPGVRYPLLIVIHGGPAAVSRPVPSMSIYPIDIWLNKGALVLEPNYRGSTGYGEAFRSLNVRNLGIGDAWDVVSGIDHLVAQGLVDNDKVGTMGWSQGGYISAFLTTHDSARFKAVSVGAGISNWMTYYVNTDIHPFTRQYLKATPWDDPKIYADTSPMTYIKQAKAPTLIQHGELDRRVPIPNAFELYQGLQDVGAPTKLVVYKGFGHGLTKPKANRAAMEHNLEWFGKYIWGEAPPPAAPVKEPFEGVNNFYRVSDTVACGGAMKPEVAAELKRRGYAAIINLRSADEPGADVELEKTAAAAAGLRYVHIPTSRGTTVVKSAVDQFLAAVTDAANLPVYIHCGSGPRVSSFWAIRRVKVDGWALDRALLEAEAMGLTPALKEQVVGYLR